MMMPALRVKFEFAPLVNEILDQLPADVWTSTTTTFLDPAFGGGQFLREIERRLREVGHSEDNICSRVYGCEVRQIRINWTWDHGRVKTRNLIKTEFLDYDWGDMKFDVIVGNPPYQSPKKGDSSYWARFVAHSNRMLKPQGWNAMVIPCGWMSPTNDIREGRQSVLRDILAKQHTPLISVDPQMGSTYFPGVGQRFSYYVTQNSTPSGETRILLGNDQHVNINLSHMPMLPLNPDAMGVSIVHKLSQKLDKWDFVRSNKCDYADVSMEKPTRTHKHPRLNGNTNHLDKIVYSKTPCEFTSKKKVVLPYYGTKYKFVVDNGQMGVTNCYVMVLHSKDLVSSARVYFDSPLMAWLGKNKFTQYNEAALIECVGRMDLTQKITLKDIWDYYGFTPEEIAYIEQNA